MTTQGPNPYAPAADPPPPPKKESAFAGRAQATTGQRVAGGMLLVNAVLALVAALSAKDGSGAMSGGAMVGPAIIDIVIGVTLLNGSGRLVPLAMIRVVLGTIFFSATSASQNPVGVVLQLLIAAGLLLAMIGDASKARLGAGASIFGLACVLLLGILAGDRLGKGSLVTALLSASGQVEPEPVHDLTGEAYPYTLHFPGDSWRLRKAQMAKKDLAIADRWVMRPDMGANVVTIVEQAPGKVVHLEKYVEVILDAAAKQTSAFSVVERLPYPASPDDGRIVRVTFTEAGITYERYYGLFTAADRGFQVMATAPEKQFGAVSAELKAIVESFRLPPEAWTSGITDDYEKAPVGEVTGVAQGYKIKAPNDRWHLRKDEAAKKDQPAADRWITRPDRAAHVIVIAERLPGQKLSIDRYVEAVEENAKRAVSRYERVSVGPLPSDPVHGRVLRTSVTLNGMELDYVYAILTAEDRGFQIIGLAEHIGFAGVEKDLDAIIASFQLPPEVANK